MAPHKPFALDVWINEYQPKSKITLHDSCVDPLTLNEIQSFNPSTPILSHDTPLSYVAARGIEPLRKVISSLYKPEQVENAVTPYDVLVTTGAISGNGIVLQTLLSPGDHVIVQHPIFNQLVEIPRYAGAEVTLWKQHFHDEHVARWSLDVAELKSLIKPTTKLILLNNPSNPTGLALTKEQLQAIIDIAKPHNITIMCDEIFRFLHHSSEVPAPPSLLDLGYKHSIVTASLSKSFAVPGIRVGWIAVHPSLSKTVLKRFAETSDYTTISVSGLDQTIAAFVLQPEVGAKILSRSKEICNKNVATVMEWADRNKEWISVAAPTGAGTCVARIKDRSGQVVDDRAFSKALTLEEGVLVPPAGVCFAHEADGESATDLKGFFRIGVVSDNESLKQGLAAFERLQGRWQ